MKKRLGATSGGIKNCASLGRRASTRPAVSTHEVQCALSYSERHPVKAVWPSDVLMVRQSMRKEEKVEEGWMEGRVLMPARGCQDFSGDCGDV